MSVSSVSLNSDVNGRYQKLAAEYSKLRSQAKVLREGVLAERSKNDKLNEALKLKEAIVRKLETENESLIFRNEQLVKRVENLQNEVEISRDGKKDKSKKMTNISKEAANQIQSMNIRIDLLEEELRLKLKQNEDLVSQIAENDRLHGEEMAEMSEKFAKEVRLLEGEVKELRVRANPERNWKNDEEKRPIEAVKPLEKDILNESAENLIMLSRPSSPDNLDQAFSLIVETGKSVFHGFHNIFTLLQQRTETYPFDVTMEMLPKHVEKLSSEYAQCARLFYDSTSLMETFLEKSKIEIEEDLPKVASKIDLITKHCRRMLIELITSMMIEENRVTWCSGQLAELNEQWKQKLEEIFECFEQINKSMKIKKEEDEEEKGAIEPNIVEHISELAEKCSQLSLIFENRWQIESRLPTTTRRMRCIGTAMKSALNLLAADIGKLSARTKIVVRMMAEKEVNNEEEEEELKTPIIKTNVMNPFKTDEKKEGVEQNENLACRRCLKAETDAKTILVSEKYCQTIEMELKNEDVVNETLKTEIETLKEKIRGMQQEKEKLAVDFLLIKRKLELANGNEKFNMADIEHLREIGKERMRDLMIKLEKAECSTNFYKKECEMLILLQISKEREENNLKNRVQEAIEMKNRVEEELASVRKGYESQIVELSEHMANLMKVEKVEAEIPPKETESGRSRSSIKSFFKS